MATPYPKTTRASLHAEVPSMRPQDFCSLPWCGQAPGGPTKAHNVRYTDADGKLRTERVEYPALIDAHHPWGRPGPVVYICHECHMAHHDGRRRLTFAYFAPGNGCKLSGWYVQGGDSLHREWLPLRTEGESS